SRSSHRPTHNEGNANASFVTAAFAAAKWTWITNSMFGCVAHSEILRAIIRRKDYNCIRAQMTFLQCLHQAANLPIRIRSGRIIEPIRSRQLVELLLLHPRGSKLRVGVVE